MPLIHKISKTKLPIIASTGGASLQDIDRVVQIFENSNSDFALHHCVSIYPTPTENLQLNQIGVLKNRYNVEVGWSTHEDPNDYVTIQLALAKGAKFFERHIGLETKVHKLNAYSSNSDQLVAWFKAFRQAKLSMGAPNRPPATEKEKISLDSLQRGTYAKREIEKGKTLTREDIYFAMPKTKDSLFSGNWVDGLIADKSYSVDEAINSNIQDVKINEDTFINDVLLQVKGMLRDSKIHIGKNSKIELSHHYGLERIREYGAIIFDIINRDYCKKIIVMLPRQKHPYHYHEKKEETFQILSGSMEIEKNGEPCKLNPGDTYLVERKQWHKFSTLDGVIFEEVSTTHYNNDSYYQDLKIAKLDRETRKTVVKNWIKSEI